METNIKQQADQRLSETKIIEILSNYGDAYVTGSYALDLMARKELDINLVVDNYESIPSIASDVIRLLSPISLDYRNRSLPETKIRIDGHWMLVKCLDGWNFDIWVIGKEEHEKQMQIFTKLQSKLNNDNRPIIIQIKNQAQQDEDVKKAYTGQSVYDAVLDKGVINFEQYKNYLAESNS